MIDSDLSSHPRRVERPEGDPEGVLDLRAQRNCGPCRQREYKWTDEDRWENRGSRIEVVQDAEAFCLRQVDADFFHRLADRGGAEVGVTWLAAPARKRDLPGPGVAYPYRAMNEERFDPFIAIVEDDGDGGGNHPTLEWDFDRPVFVQLATCIL